MSTAVDGVRPDPAGRSAEVWTGAPERNSMDVHPGHAVVLVWLMVLGNVRWPMLVTVLRSFRTGLLALTDEEASVVRASKAILADLDRAGLVEETGAGWKLTDLDRPGPVEDAGVGWKLTEFGRQWCDTWNVPGSSFAMRLAAAREFTSAGM